MDKTINYLSSLPVENQIRYLFSAIEYKKVILPDWRSNHPYDLLIAISSGHLNKRPFDLMSLSYWAKMPRTSCQREISILIESHLITRQKDGRRYLLIPTLEALVKIESYVKCLDIKRQEYQK
jgi:hypothetical protein